MTADAMRYRNLYTMSICPLTTYYSVVTAKRAGKVWYLTQDEVIKVQFMLRMEVCKIYIGHYNGWCATYGLMAHEIAGTEVSHLFMCMINNQ